MRLSSFVAALVLASASLAAHADNFIFSFGNSSTLYKGTGILTTGSLLAPGEFSIGTLNGTATTTGSASLLTFSLLAPGVFPTIQNGNNFPANDNTLFVTNGIGSLDGNGLSFLLSDGEQVNFYNPQGGTSNALLLSASGTELLASLPLAITVTPEPSSVTLLCTGLLGVAGVMKRRLK